MISWIQRWRERRAQEREAELQRILEQRNANFLAARKELAKWSEEMVGATLYTDRNLPEGLLEDWRTPYFEKMVINKRIGGGLRSTGWEQHDASGKRDGFVREYSLHGMTAGEILKVLDNPEVQKAYVACKPGFPVGVLDMMVEEMYGPGYRRY